LNYTRKDKKRENIKENSDELKFKIFFILFHQILKGIYTINKGIFPLKVK